MLYKNTFFVNDNYENILKKFKESTITNNLISMGIFPNITGDKVKIFSGHIGEYFNLHFLHNYIDFMNPCISGEIINEAPDLVKISFVVKPNPIFKLVNLFFSVLCVLVSIMLLCGAFPTLKIIEKCVFSALLIAIVIAINVYLRFVLNKTKNKFIQVCEQMKR